MTKILIMRIKLTCFKQHMYQTGLRHSRVLIRKTQKRGSQNSHNDFGYWISRKFTISSISGWKWYFSDSKTEKRPNSFCIVKFKNFVLHLRYFQHPVMSDDVIVLSGPFILKFTWTGYSNDVIKHDRMLKNLNATQIF